MYGICGVELSDLYLRLYYPAWESDFGNMVTVIAPMENNVLQLSQGMSGAIDGTYLESTDNLYMQQAKNFNIYSGHSEKYLGVHTKLDMNMANGSSMYAVTLVPESSYSSVTTKDG